MFSNPLLRDAAFCGCGTCPNGGNWMRFRRNHMRCLHRVSLLLGLSLVATSGSARTWSVLLSDGTNSKLFISGHSGMLEFQREGDGAFTIPASSITGLSHSSGIRPSASLVTNFMLDEQWGSHAVSWAVDGRRRLSRLSYRFGSIHLCLCKGIFLFHQ
jgi:hypothetical protein